MIPGHVVGIEARKLTRSAVTRVATATALILAPATSAGGYAAATLAPDTQVGTKAAGLMTTVGWSGLTGLAAMGTGVTILLAAGIVASWLVGREFTDGTVVGLFALPVGPSAIALAKLLVITAWSAALAVASGALTALAGICLGLPVTGAAGCAGTITLIGVLLGAGALPMAWFATLGRGYLAGIAAALGIVIVTNLAIGLGIGALIPWATPVLWATSGGNTPPLALLLPLAAGLAGTILTTRSWGRLELGNR